MKVADYAIRHPAVITILLVALVVFGVISAGSINRALTADINIPTVMVITTWPGVGPEDIEGEITDFLEEELGTLEGLKQMTSTSRNSVSAITLEFNFGENAEERMPEIREKINNVMDDLPSDLPGPPQMFKFSSSALPVMTILAEGAGTRAELSRFCRDEVIPSLSRIPGVARVNLSGDSSDIVEIRVDLPRLEALGLSLLAVYQAFEYANVSLPGGDGIYQDYSLNIRTEGRFASLTEMEDLVIAFRDNTFIRLKDVALVRQTQASPSGYVISDGRDTLALTMVKQSGADASDVSREVRKALAVLEADNPGAAVFQVVLDDRENIDISISSVLNSAVLGAFLAVLILFLFLHNHTTTLIVGVAIPLSILFTLIGLKVRGLTLNLITLGGITTAIGMIVDSSIVVLENIHRNFTAGMTRQEAASLGTAEVGGAVIASTSTSLAAFIPILFLTGLTGLILKDVAWTIIFALFSSLIVAIVVVPFLSALFLKKEAPVTRLGSRMGILFEIRIEKALDTLARRYRQLLENVMGRMPLFLTVMAALLVLSALSFQLLGFEFLSQTDMAEAQVLIETPGGYTLEMTRDKVLQVEKELRELVPELKSTVFYAGQSGAFTSGEERNKAYGTLKFTRVKERNRHVMEIIRVLQEEIPRRIPDVDVNFKNGGVSALLALVTGGDGLVVEVYGNSLDSVAAGAERVREFMKQDPNVADTDVNIRFNDREMVARLFPGYLGQLGLTAYEAALTTRIIFNGISVGSYHGNGEVVPMELGTSLAGGQIPSDILYGLSLLSREGKLISFANFAGLETRETVSVINHRNKSRSIMVSAGLKDPNVRETSRRVTGLIREKGLPPGVKWRLSGSSAEMMSSFRSLIFIMLIALFLVYVVMVIQFERFSQPLIVMVSIPFTLIGVVGGLLVFGSSLSLVSFMGIIALAGIVVNNAIVLIDYINLLRQRDSLPLKEAVLAGSSARLKPILMTTLTTLLGIIPLAIGMGEGSEIYSPLGQSIAGGLTTSTFITLLLVPVLYYLLEKHKEKKIAQ